MNRSQTDAIDGLSIEDVHDILRNNRRRLAIQCLKESPEGKMQLGELAETVARLETGEDPPPRDKRKSAYISLHQSHLSKLDEWGIVDYDTTTKEIELRDTVEAIEPFMTLDGDSNGWWREGYFLLGLVGVLLTVTNGALFVELWMQATVVLLFGLTMIVAAIDCYLSEQRWLFVR